MRPNPGGRIQPQDVVGRDVLIQRLWDIINRQSLILVAERRIGKTTVVNKMRAESPDDIAMFYTDVEGIHTAYDFTVATTIMLGRRRPSWLRASDFVGRHIRRWRGANIANYITIPEGAAGHWKEVLTGLIRAADKPSEGLVVFVWDEFPTMLSNVAGTEEPQTALELLEVLRGLRQTCPGVRMVFTGSIGLHHVLKAMQQAGAYGPATNDMQTEEVPPLGSDAAVCLVSELLKGKMIAAADSEDLAGCIAAEVDGHPHFIQCVCDDLPANGTVSIQDVRKLVQDRIGSPQGSWQLPHYDHRLDDYYGPQAGAAREILGAIAHSDQPLTRDEIVHRILARTRDVAEDEIRELLDMLCNDHYLTCSDGAYDFKFSVVKRWWRENRG